MSSWKKNKLPSQKFKTKYDKYRTSILADKREEKMWIEWIQAVEHTHDMIEIIESMLCSNASSSKRKIILKTALNKWIKQFIGPIQKQDYFHCVVMERDEKIQLKKNFIILTTSLVHKNCLEQLNYLCDDLVEWSDEFSQYSKPTIKYYEALKQQEKKEKRR